MGRWLCVWSKARCKNGPFTIATFTTHGQRARGILARATEAVTSSASYPDVVFPLPHTRSEIVAGGCPLPPPAPAPPPPPAPRIMADTLRRLTSTSSFGALQEKLESWHREYHIISCDQNLDRCCELIEMTSKIQGQLFTILNLTAAEDRHYAAEDTLRTRLLPWLSTCSLMARSSGSNDTSLQLMQESMEKDRRIRELSASRDNDMQQLCSTRLQLESTRAELDDTQEELDETKRKSARTLLATEDEMVQMKAELVAALEQVEVSKRKLEAFDESQEQIRLLRNEVSSLSAENTVLQDRRLCTCTPARCTHPTHTHTHTHTTQAHTPTTRLPLRSSSPPRTSAQLTAPSRRARLVSRFCELYGAERLEAQKVLRRHIADLEMVQKIIFIAVVESFNRAKRAYRQLKARWRKTLSPSHSGPESLEDATRDFLVHNMHLYDVQSSMKDVLDAMSVDPWVTFLPEVDFFFINSLIREACKAAFAMQMLEPPLDLAPATDRELYDDRKYRRSYDSERAAPRVMYHVWPALVEGDAVVVKGEAVTRQGAAWSRSPSRSSSPTRSRSLSPTRTLAFNSRRSLSPERLTSSLLTASYL
ncbi:LOW QUALITY PROTEIN: mitochondria-eating protein [Gasterosteus aculeatus]